MTACFLVGVGVGEKIKTYLGDLSFNDTREVLFETSDKLYQTILCSLEMLFPKSRSESSLSVRKYMCDIKGMRERETWKDV